jgi:opacity protein-like surface antigen
MKKIVILIVLVSSYVFAQQGIMKGSYTVGGNIGFSSYSEDGNSNNQTRFVFMPNVGYFFIDQLYAGLQLQYIHASSGDLSGNTFGIGPELRYYFLLDKLTPYLGISYTYSKDTFDDEDLESTYSSFTMSGGVDYFVTDFFALEASLNYSLTNFDYTTNNNSSGIDATEFNLNIGAKYFIF